MLTGVSGRIVAMRVGDVELLVETSAAAVAGSQPTSTLGEASQRVLDGFERAEEAIVQVASSVAGTLTRMAERSGAGGRTGWTSSSG
jgi:hypothetical protein